MLAEKTKGNLTEQEQTLLNSAIDNLNNLFTTAQELG